MKAVQFLHRGGPVGRAISYQLLAAGTSVGANYEEADGANTLALGDDEDGPLGVTIDVLARCASAYKLLNEYAREAECWRAALAIAPQSPDISLFTSRSIYVCDVTPIEEAESPPSGAAA